MPRKRTHIILPDDLLAEIDALVGQRAQDLEQAATPDLFP
jgi:hypothetical protein